MTTRLPAAAQDMSNETIEGLQELIQGLRDSVNYHTAAADRIDDDFVKRELLAITLERREIYQSIGGFIATANSNPVVTGTLLGSLRTIWTSFRAGLNAGDPTVVLIEAARAEAEIARKFKEILVDISGNPINNVLLGYYENIKAGHDRIVALRNAFQNA